MQFDLSKRFTQLLFVLILGFSIALQGWGHAYGLNLTSDSYQYLSAARSFKTNGTFLSPDGSYYTYWPPLFPVILSLFDHPEQALMWIYVLVKIFIATLIFFLANEFLEKNILKVVFLAVSLCSVQMIMISVFVWSEMIFLLLLLLTVYCALKMKASSLYFTGLLVFGFLLCLQRNAGAFIIPAIAFWIGTDQSLKVNERIVKSVVVCASGLAGLCLWNIYVSYFIPSNFYFYRHDFFEDIALNFSRLSAALIKFFVPGSEIPATFFGLVMLLGVVVFIVKTGYQSRHMKLIGFVVLFYWIGFMSLGKLDVYEMDRYLSVIVPMVYLLFFFLAENIPIRLKPAQQGILIVVLVLWMVYPIGRAVKNVRLWNERSYSSYRTK